MDIIKKTSLLSDSRFPMFVRGNSDYDALRRFIKSYFESIEEVKNANHEITYSRENSDIDSTTEDFLERFYSILCPDLPTNIKANKRLLLKHSRELYQKKGTPESFHLLFRILFDDTISIRYPAEYILRASDGIWNQPTSIRVTFVNIPESKVLSLAYQDIYCKNKNGIVRNFVLDVKKVKNSDVYEIYIDNKQGTAFNIGDTVTIDGITGTVTPTITSIKILSRGKKFKLGETIFLDIEPTKDTVIKVTKVDDNGGILSAKIINYGINYTNNLYASVAPAENAKVIEQKPQEIVGYPIEESSNGFYESVSIVQMGKIGPLYDYFAEDYTVLEQYYTSSIVSSFGGITSGGVNSTSDDYATISIIVGSVIRYPGYWSSNRGFLNDPIIRLQDNAFYQNFSYVIRSAISRERYEPYVKTIVHPAGFRMFSETFIEDEFDLSTDISSESGTDYKVYSRDIATLDDFKYIDINSIKNDELLPEELIGVGLSLHKTDNIGVTDISTNNIVLTKSDTETLSESLVKGSNLTYSDVTNITESNGVATVKLMDEELIQVTDTLFNNIVLTKSDTETLSESLVKGSNLTCSDVTNITESNGTAISAIKSDAATVTDFVFVGKEILNNDIVGVLESVSNNINIQKQESLTVSEIVSKSINLTSSDVLTATSFDTGAYATSNWTKLKYVIGDDEFIIQ